MLDRAIEALDARGPRFAAVLVKLHNAMQIALAAENDESAFEAFAPGVVNATGPIVDRKSGYHSIELRRDEPLRRP